VLALACGGVDDTRHIAATPPLDGKIEIEVSLDGRRRLLSSGAPGSRPASSFISRWMDS
jgi:hypothetical protein